MYDLLTAQEIRKKFRATSMRDISLQAIHHIAQKLGYKQKHIGNKVGYHKSVDTALTRHFAELMCYDASLDKKTPQNDKKHPLDINYVTYNGEPDKKDYEWELDDSVISRKILEVIEELEQESLGNDIEVGTK